MSDNPSSTLMLGRENVEPQARVELKSKSLVLLYRENVDRDLQNIRTIVENSKKDTASDLVDILVKLQRTNAGVQIVTAKISEVEKQVNHGQQECDERQRELVGKFQELEAVTTRHQEQLSSLRDCLKFHEKILTKIQGSLSTTGNKCVDNSMDAVEVAYAQAQKRLLESIQEILDQNHFELTIIDSDSSETESPAASPKAILSASSSPLTAKPALSIVDARSSSGSPPAPSPPESASEEDCEIVPMRLRSYYKKSNSSKGSRPTRCVDQVVPNTKTRGKNKKAKCPMCRKLLSKKYLPTHLKKGPCSNAE